MAVDNLVERLALANPKLPVVRVGHPARLLPQASFSKELASLNEMICTKNWLCHVVRDLKGPAKLCAFKVCDGRAM